MRSIHSITRRTLLASGAAVTGGLGLSRASASTTRPNILWIITDDQPPSTLPYMKNVMERIAGKGVLFNRGYAAVPFCGPARASMFTSMNVHRHGCASNDTLVPFRDNGHDQDTVATRLNNAGYRTGLFGKYLNGYRRAQRYVGPGWDRWVANIGAGTGHQPAPFNVDGRLRYAESYGGVPDQFAAVQCKRFIEKAVNTPWFAVYAPTAPHRPHTPSPKHADDFDGVAWDPPALNEDDMSDKPSFMQNIPPKDRETLRQAWEGTLEELQDTDDRINSILSTLNRTGQLLNTHIFVVSDNGFMLGEHRLHMKQQPYEESSGIPFAVRGPGIGSGVSAELVSQVDMMPTTLAMAGLDPTAGRELDGRNMLPGLRSNDWSGWRQRMLVEHPLDEWAMLIEGSARFIDHYGHGEQQFYDLSTDPHQMRSDPARPEAAGHHAQLTLMRNAQGQALKGLETH